MKASLSGRPRLARALRAGFTVRVTNAQAGKLTLTARTGKTVVARGSTVAKAGQAATVKLKFTAKARTKLRRARSAKVTIYGAGAPLHLTLKR